MDLPCNWLMKKVTLSRQKSNPRGHNQPFLLCLSLSLFTAKPHSSVGPRLGQWFDPRLGQCSFRGLMIVIATWFIPLSPLSVVSTMVMWESRQWGWKEYCAKYWLKVQECMDRCAGHHDITEILSKTPLNQ